MSVRVWVTISVATGTFWLAACGESAERGEARGEMRLVEWRGFVNGTLMEDWINRAGVVGIENAGTGGVPLYFSTPYELVWLLPEQSVSAGETWRAELDVEPVFDGPSEVRLILARDCATGDAELSESVRSINARDQIVVEHTFQLDYDCIQVQLNVLNASAERPVGLAVHHVAMTLVEG